MEEPEKRLGKRLPCRESEKRTEPGSIQWCQVTRPEVMGSENIGKHFFPLRVTEHWHKLPREVVESPLLDIFGRSHLDTILGKQLWGYLLEQGSLTQMTSRSSFQLQPLCNLTPYSFQYCVLISDLSL